MPVRVYQDNLIVNEQLLQLDAQAAVHVAKVLRMRVGEALILFDGSNREFHGEIAQISKHQVLVTILQQQELSRESPLNIHLAQGLSKGERMDWVVQKAVELGVAQITPVITQHNAVKLPSEKVAKKVEHWQRIAISACEQSGRNVVPTINPPQPLAVMLESPTPMKVILHPNASNAWRQTPAPSQLMLFIGPEGGFSATEIEQANAHGCMSVPLGPRILRTETAAVAALSVLQHLWGDL